jgi:putative ABC transport system permease protein
LGSPVVVLLVGLAAGAYPAICLTRYQPAAVMKSGGASVGGKVRARNVLVVAQFSIAIALVVGTLTAYNQISYMTDKELGFQKEQVVVLSNVPSLTPSRMATIKDALLNSRGVEGVAFSTAVPGQQTSNESYLPEGFVEEERLLIHGMQVDPDFVNTLGLEIVSGRNFSSDYPTDSSHAFLITEMAARKFGWDDAVGKRLKHKVMTDAGMVWEEKTVIGVVKDFHYASLHNPLEPLVLEYQTNRLNFCSVKLAADNPGATIDRVRESWLGVMPDRPFDFFFLDESLTGQYSSEQRLGNILMALTVLAVLTGCLGLVGLVTFLTELRTKEIGVRKVLGASVTGVVRLLTGKFVLLILIANGIAWPAAYGVMKWWLSNFAYRVDLTWHVFVLSGAVALGVAVLSVGYRALRAAQVSPIKAIRYE